MNPHKWFFGYVRTLADYKEEYAKVIREGIVFQYTDGQTVSLAEMYSDYRSEYDEMRKEIMTEFHDELNRARKRLIAVLFAYLRDRNPNMQYVKATACRSAGTASFNEIHLTVLHDLYSQFVAKNLSRRTTAERGLILEGMRNEHKN